MRESTDFVGTVIPAYQPNVTVLKTYIRDLDSALSPDTVRIEIDNPNEETVQELVGLPVVLNTVPYRRGKGAAISYGFDTLETDVKTFVSQVATVTMLGVALGRLRGELSRQEASGVLDSLRGLPGALQQVLDREAEFKAIAEEYADREAFFLLGGAVRPSRCA